MQKLIKSVCMLYLKKARFNTAYPYPIKNPLMAGFFLMFYSLTAISLTPFIASAILTATSGARHREAAQRLAVAIHDNAQL